MSNTDYTNTTGVNPGAKGKQFMFLIRHPCYSVNKRYRTPNSQSKIDNPIQRNWQQGEEKQNNNTTICVGYHYAQSHTNNVKSG